MFFFNLHRLTSWWGHTNGFSPPTKDVKLSSLGKYCKYPNWCINCRNVSDTILWRIHKPHFSNNPTTISIDLQFGGLVNIGEYKDIVAGIIFEDAPRFRYMNNLGHLVGDLLVFYDSWEYILHGQYRPLFDNWCRSDHTYCKSGHLRMGEIYSSNVVSLKSRKIPPSLW